MEKHRKIKVVAIAKDEAAYIHEWAYHHLYFGFDGVEIILNRTTDNSVELMSKLKENISGFDFLSSDWIDLCAPSINIKMQEVAYAQACERATNEGYTHILFIDVDEFWTPKNFKTSIHEFLDQYPLSTSVSFNWICELGGKEDFAPISGDLDYFLSTHLKTLSNIGDIKEIRIHTPGYKEGSHHVMADGTIFSAKKHAPQFHEQDITGLEDAFVIHRLYRSEAEYAAVLYRGNPDSKTRGSEDFKLNRHGYNFNQGSGERHIFPKDLMDTYRGGLQQFIEDSKCGRELHSARQSVLHRAKECVEAAVRLEQTNFRLLQQLFDGCENQLIKPLLNVKDKIVSSFDVIKTVDDTVVVSGWAFVKHAFSELQYSVKSLPSSSLDWTKANRDDVVKKFRWAPVDCGFDLRMKLSGVMSTQKSEGSITVEIKEADLVKVFHGTYLFYDVDQNLLRHGHIKDLRSKSWLIPTFFTKFHGDEVLAILSTKKVMILGANEGKVKGLTRNEIPKNSRLFVKQPQVDGVFPIKHGECYTGAAPSGDVYFNRAAVKEWETFKSDSNPHAAVESISLHLPR